MMATQNLAVPFTLPAVAVSVTVCGELPAVAPVMEHCAVAEAKVSKAATSKSPFFPVAVTDTPSAVEGTGLPVPSAPSTV